MMKKFVFILFFLFGLFLVAATKPSDARAITVSLSANLDNTSGHIGVNVYWKFLDGTGAVVGQNTTAVPAGANTGAGVSLGTYTPDYTLIWSTDCTDPQVNPLGSTLWGGSLITVSFGVQDVSCKTPNIEPVITSATCSADGSGIATVNWTVVGGTPNVDHFAIFRSYQPNTNPDNYYWGNAPGGGAARSISWSGLALGDWYVRVSAVSPQGQYSSPSYASFRCVGVSAPAVNPPQLISANPTCSTTGFGNIVKVDYSWTPATPSSEFYEQWLDYSVWPNNFSPGTFSNYGPLAVSINSYSTPANYAQGVVYYWRVNAHRNDGGWSTSLTGTFTTPTCPSGPPPSPTASPSPTPTGSTCPPGCTKISDTFTVQAVQWQVKYCLDAAMTYGCAGTSGWQFSDRFPIVGSAKNVTYYWHADILILFAGSSQGWANGTVVGNGGIVWFNVGTAIYHFKFYDSNNSYLQTIDYNDTSTSDQFAALTTTALPPNMTLGGSSQVTVNAYANFGTEYKQGNLSGTTTGCSCPTPPPSPTPPPAPGGLSSNEPVCSNSNFGSQGQPPEITLSWVAVPGVTGYEVWFTRDNTSYGAKGIKIVFTNQAKGTGDWSQSGFPSNEWVTAASGGDLNLAPGATYYWRVRAQASGLWSGFSFDDQVGPVPNCPTKPADPSNLIVTTACSANKPQVTFSFKDNSTVEDGFWLDVNTSAWTSDVGPTPWGVKTITTPNKTGTGGTITFLWNDGAKTNTSGQMDSGSPLSPADNTRYWWRVKAFTNTGQQQSEHVYPASTDGSKDTLIPSGIYFKTLNCNQKWDLSASFVPSSWKNSKGQMTQVFYSHEQVTIQVLVTNNSSLANVASPANATIGFWPSTGKAGDPALPNCPSSPQAPPSGDPYLITYTPSTIPSLAPGANQAVTVQFNAPINPDTYTAYFYVVPNCTTSGIPATDADWTNNRTATGFTYMVTTPAWFETLGGDVGAANRIQVSQSSASLNRYQSQYLLAANSVDPSVTVDPKGWKLNSYNKPLVPSGGVYQYFNERFRAKATAQCTFSGALADGIYYCAPVAPATDITVNVLTVAPGNHVFFIDGNLVVAGNIVVPSTSTAVFVVSGNITIKTAVTQADGVYIAARRFSDWDSSGSTGNWLVINGAVYANSYSLNRTLGGSCTAPPSPSCDNSKTPADQINYQPKYVMTMPSLLGSPTVSWKEVAP